MISKLCLIVDHALDLQNVFDSSQMSIQDTFIVIEKIMQYIDQLEGMRDSIVIKGSDLELKKKYQKKQKILSYKVKNPNK